MTTVSVGSRPWETQDKPLSIRSQRGVLLTRESSRSRLSGRAEILPIGRHGWRSPKSRLPSVIKNGLYPSPEPFNLLNVLKSGGIDTARTKHHERQEGP